MTLENQEIFAYLIDRYQSKLARYIKRLTNYIPEEVEDLLQDIFIKVYKNLNSFDRDLKFSSWIYRIAHNEVISNFRQKNRRPHCYPGDDNERELINLVSEINIEKEINNKLTRESIKKVMDELDEKYSEVLILKYFEEKNYEEMSDILEKPLGTVATLLNRAKKEFKKELEKNNIKI
ncbi:MAG: sigma-70 family RNA polymerase sigma factor [Patescibacteria group bacterium]|nr:sigma-70 family RNA polymerase sigma factor [Patescibacteria group bacterium]MDD4610436.1 sigma-70 family RNA polymerase sigma factor [Patescibacteria group bacterium]